MTREYQEDLEAGRYEPEWLAEAGQAMEERAAGKFDKYKEDQFEEFWGQKQKIDLRALAGDSTKTKLEQLLRDGFIKVGDEFSYRRVFGAPGAPKIMVEKDVKVCLYK